MVSRNVSTGTGISPATVSGLSVGRKDPQVQGCSGSAYFQAQGYNPKMDVLDSSFVLYQVYPNLYMFLTKNVMSQSLILLFKKKTQITNSRE